MIETADHIINREIFEFRFAEPEHAFALQKQMNAGLQSGMQITINNVLREWDNNDETFRVDKLEIDLGEIPFEQLTDLVPSRFYSQFKEKLNAAIAETTAHGSIHQDETFDKINLLEIFLLSGSLPWWAGRNNNFSVDEIINHLVKYDASRLRTLLFKHITNEQFAERLFYQTNADTFIQLMELLIISPRLIDAIEDHLQKGMAVSPGYRYSPALRKNIFRLLIKLVNVYQESFPDEKLQSLLSEKMIEVFGGAIIDSVEAPSMDNLITKDIHSATESLINEIAKYKNEKDTGSTNSLSAESDEKIYIQNTGLILVAVFLPALFRQLEWTNEGSFTKKEMQFKAIFLLHYLSTGETAAPEYTLQLNKILCGLSREEPIPFSVDLTDNEKLEARLLLQDIITHWTALKNSSVEGLQGSFLMRDGLLSFHNNHWLLQAERKGYDILLDQVPWSWRMTKLDWMETYIDTEW